MLASQRMYLFKSVTLTVTNSSFRLLCLCGNFYDFSSLPPHMWPQLCQQQLKLPSIDAYKSILDKALTSGYNHEIFSAAGELDEPRI